MGLEAALFLLDVFVTALCTYAAVKLRRIELELNELILILFLVSLIALIPQIGFVISLVVFFALLVAMTDTEAAELMWVVLVAKLSYLGILVIADLRWDIDWQGVLT